MARVLFHVGPGPGPGATFAVCVRPVEMERLPVAGDLVSLGIDVDGVPADYCVVLVRSFPPSAQREVDAEVYARRVVAADEVRARAPAHPADAPWRAGARVRSGRG